MFFFTKVCTVCGKKIPDWVFHDYSGLCLRCEMAKYKKSQEPAPTCDPLVGEIGVLTVANQLCKVDSTPEVSEKMAEGRGGEFGGAGVNGSWTEESSVGESVADSVDESSSCCESSCDCGSSCGGD